MKILWDKKLIKFSNGSYIAWGLKRKKFFFANKNELKLNCTIIEYYEEREKCEEKVNSDLKKIIANLEAQISDMSDVINDLVHLGTFDENTDEEYLNYEVHEALKKAEKYMPK